MIFLVPIFIIIAVIFGINYAYFDDVKQPYKIEKTQIDQQELNDYIKKITK